MRVLPWVSVSRVVVPGDAPWPLQARGGRRWDFPHFALQVRIRQHSTWLILPLGIRRYMTREGQRAR